MKNDKQITFTELSFQPFFRKICNNYSVSKTNFVKCLNPHFVLAGYFTRDQICNPDCDYDLSLKILKKKLCLSHEITIQRWYWAPD